MTPAAQNVLTGLLHRRVLCESLIIMEAAQLAVAEAEAVAAEAVALAKPSSKEAKAEAERKRAIASNLLSLRDSHVDEIAGIAEIQTILRSA